MSLSNDQLITVNELTEDIGKRLVKIARQAIEVEIGLRKNVDESLFLPVMEKKGLAFVTLEKKSGSTTSLRGCIGYVEAVASLKDIVRRAAIGAAFSDPRFPPLRKNEIDDVIIEVTVLTRPEEIVVDNRKDLVNFVKVGEDGLIVEHGIMHSGLLLPQVPMEYCWDSETFLAETCIKAGLDPDCWLNPRVKVKKFQGIIFREVDPNSDNIAVLKPNQIKCKKDEILNL
ncbi:TIGR00296 family protein [Stygiolobus caldivivus]|uniref:Protein KN1_16910 n=1 Tax=Stygiolobus caldivivus TaxID=2824673 RepID=A0A8D5ZI87_9CREN|nr:TIGR00296 family protein [Stygiolobus caldivivus]BCU70394.1 TIGR00296 family protein [Stygiolobus caldivivus]